jgi:hypothetical protein
MSRKNNESPDSRSRGANANFPIKKKLKEDNWPIWLNELLTNTGNVQLAIEEIDNDAQTDDHVAHFASLNTTLMLMASDNRLIAHGTETIKLH